MAQFHPDPYDQYTQFNQLPKLLKRIPFASKMQQCYAMSYKSLDYLKLADKMQQKSNIPLPWVVESLALLCIASIENPNCSANPKINSQFVKMYNAVWNAIPNDMTAAGDDFIKFFGAAFAQTQFGIQETSIIKYYRYHYIFNYEKNGVSIRSSFQKKFSASYWEYLQLCELIMGFFGIKKPLNASLLNRLLSGKFQAVGKQLCISRSNYIAELQRMTNNSEDISRYIFCVRPSYKYAFIEDNGAWYFPLPHLLPLNVTSSMLYRLTEGDNVIRELVGKPVLEEYLLSIVKTSNVYDYVHGEIKYQNNGSESLGPDVIATVDGDIMFLDSKTFVPLKDLRFFEKDAYEKTKKRYVENIIQLYKQVLSFPSWSNCFPEITSFDNDHIWCASVVHESARLLDQEIYSAVNGQLKISDDSQEASWIKTHIKIISLYDAELYCFSSLNLIDGIKTSFSNSHDFTLTSRELLGFQDRLLDSLHEVAEKVFC